MAKQRVLFAAKKRDTVLFAPTLNASYSRSEQLRLSDQSIKNAPIRIIEPPVIRPAAQLFPHEDVAHVR